MKIKRLVNHYEERMLEFLGICIVENLKIHTQVSLSQLCEPDSILDSELRRFLFSASAVDALITDSDFMPRLAVEFQSPYHDKPTVQERDRKKAEILSLAGIPLIYSRVKNFGLLHLASQDEEIIFNLFTGEGRDQAKIFIRQYCEASNCSMNATLGLPLSPGL